MALGGLEHTQPRVATLIVDGATRQGAQGETKGDEHDEAGKRSGGERSGNGAAPNLAALTVKVSVSNGDNVRFKLLPGMAYADVQARLRESIEGQIGDMRLRYQDEDDEWCALNGDSDLAECIQVCQSRGMVRMQAAR